MEGRVESITDREINEMRGKKSSKREKVLDYYSTNLETSGMLLWRRGSRRESRRSWCESDAQWVYFNVLPSRSRKRSPAKRRFHCHYNPVSTCSAAFRLDESRCIVKLPARPPLN